MCKSIQKVKIVSVSERNQVKYSKVIVIENEDNMTRPPPLSCFNQLSWPKWIKNYDPFFLIEELKEAAKDILDITKFPCSPESTSYFVARNLILTNEERLLLLGLPLSMRIKQLIEILKSYSSICCKRCRMIIAKKESIFSVASSGPQNSFMNDHGDIHDTITLSELMIEPALRGGIFISCLSLNFFF